jgi:hypothetical protein
MKKKGKKKPRPDGSMEGMFEELKQLFGASLFGNCNIDAVLCCDDRATKILLNHAAKCPFTINCIGRGSCKGIDSCGIYVKQQEGSLAV